MFAWGFFVHLILLGSIPASGNSNEPGLRVDPNGEVWVTNKGNHQVFKFDNKGESGDDGKRFNRPTDVASAPTGEIYVADGYTTPDGRRSAADFLV